MSKGNNFVVRYTNKDIMEKIEGIGEKLEDYHQELKETIEGVREETRRNSQEIKYIKRSSVGIWIRKEPFLFVLFVLLFLVLIFLKNEIKLSDLIIKLIQ